jgi:hypothetical protein
MTPDQPPIPEAGRDCAAEASTVSAAPFLPADLRDTDGRCCNRLPMTYRREGFLFCARCCRHYGIRTGKQIPCWAWRPTDGGFVPTYSKSEYVLFALHGPDPKHPHKPAHSEPSA